MLKYIGPINSGAAVGSNGSATASTTTQVVSGRVIGVYVRYNDSPPAGTTTGGTRRFAYVGLWQSA